ncbi:hypothetical protein [Streptomyces sp. C]|uniref:hypothetical protein n=1 Tax=Streptomyces sp. C TaxID=253839 RepID=UPI0001DEFA92|nr:hypothetical protein [Streptomyces sp. C]EFL19788.1 predicted protein [Streptomyces sp. C]
MSPPEVAAALDGETRPAGRIGHFPHWWSAEAGQRHLSTGGTRTAFPAWAP